MDQQDGRANFFYGAARRERDDVLFAWIADQVSPAPERIGVVAAAFANETRHLWNVGDAVDADRTDVEVGRECHARKCRIASVAAAYDADPLWIGDSLVDEVAHAR